MKRGGSAGRKECGGGCGHFVETRTEVPCTPTEAQKMVRESERQHIDEEREMSAAARTLTEKEEKKKET